MQPLGEEPSGGSVTQSRQSQASNEEESARDAHRGATILSLLVLLWGVLALATPPAEPFTIPDTTHTAVSAVVLVYLIRVRARPNRKIAETICAVWIVYALLLLPWTTIVWSRIGRPFEAFTIPEAAVVAIALVVPARWRFGIAAICLFFVESLFAYFYPRHVGLEALIPVTEPMATFGYAALGIGIFMLRRRRQDLIRQHVRLQAELHALERIRPHLEHAREQLDTQITTLASELNIAGDTRSTVAGRALARLADLRGKLDHLVCLDGTDESPHDVERRMIEHDAQLSAILLVGIAVAIAVPLDLWIHASAEGVTTLQVIPLYAVTAPMLILLVVTRNRPSLRRALWTTCILLAVTLPIITYNQYWLRELGRPFSPFLGHKLLMGILGLTLATRFRIGVGLIVAIAAMAIGTWFALDLGARTDAIVYSEPWMTLMYMLIGLVSLFIREEWQVASIQLLRAQTETSAMRRRALMFLALRDRLNSPVQTLALGAAGATSDLPARSGEKVERAVDQLVSLSRELAELDVLVPEVVTSFDADAELRRQT